MDKRLGPYERKLRKANALARKKDRDRIAKARKSNSTQLKLNG